jgi:hypothetical protein
MTKSAPAPQESEPYRLAYWGTDPVDTFLTEEDTVGAVAAVGDPELTELFRDRVGLPSTMPPWMEAHRQAIAAAVGTVTNGVFDTTTTNFMISPYRKGAGPWVTAPCESPYPSGYSVLQYCPACRSYQMSAYVGLRQEQIEWYVRDQPPPSWAVREDPHEEFRCTQAHVFRVRQEPACAPKPPVPAS